MLTHNVIYLSFYRAILGVLRATISIQFNRHPEDASSEHKVFLAAKQQQKHCVEDSPTKFAAE